MSGRRQSHKRNGGEENARIGRELLDIISKQYRTSVRMDWIKGKKNEVNERYIPMRILPLTFAEASIGDAEYFLTESVMSTEVRLAREGRA